MITSVTEKKNMQTDKGQFDEVLRRMIQKNPQKTAEIKRKRVTRKKNPHEGPMEPIEDAAPSTGDPIKNDQE